MKKALKKQLKNCRFEVIEGGFVIWHKEKSGEKRWLLDGSTFFETGEVTYSNEVGELGFIEKKCKEFPSFKKLVSVQLTKLT